MTRPTMPPDWSPPRVGARHEPARISGPHLLTLVLLIVSSITSLALVFWAASQRGL